MKLYDLIKKLLEEDEKMRDDDRLLMWEVWKLEGKSMYYITMENFMTATSTETIRRTRQKVQQDNPRLRASKGVQSLRDEKQAEKGTFVYREEIK